MDNGTSQGAGNGAADARRKGPGRGSSPWWYHPALGASMAVAVGMGSFSWDLIPYAVVVGLAIVPAALTAVVDRKYGVAVTRYRATANARRESGAYVLAIVLLVGAGILLQWGVGLPWAMAVCGVLVMVLTVVGGRRVESRVLADLRQGSA